MRKISKAQLARDAQEIQSGKRDERPRGVRGATITSWSGSCEIDLAALLSGGRNGATLSGGASEQASETIALPDGTEIKFVMPTDFETIVSL